MREVNISEHEPCMYNVIFVDSGDINCKITYHMIVKNLDSTIIRRIELFLNYSEHWRDSEISSNPS